MTFHSIVRQWCRTYKPMLDNVANGNRRFYLTDSTAGVVELAKGISNSFSPCVVMESSVEGGGKITRPSRNYPIYFFVRARDMADGDAAAEAKEEAWYHAQQFLTWLKDRHDREIAENIDGDFSRISMDDYIDIQTVGPIENGWFAVLIQFEREEPLNLCINEDLYINPEDNEP
ncbi:MAG: hypothetical protein IJV24_03210 [Prevotella sp.]|nr:hypothetical protein [Prevotella sp.]